MIGWIKFWWYIFTVKPRETRREAMDRRIAREAMERHMHEDHNGPCE